MGTRDRETIRRWHYAGPYAFYDLEADAEDLAEFLTPAADHLYLPAANEAGTLAGYMTFAPESGTPVTLAVGLGLRTDLTGPGIGLAFLEPGLAEGCARLRPGRFLLRVADFNQRALVVYRRAGFDIVRRYIQSTNGSWYAFTELERAARNRPERGTV